MVKKINKYKQIEEQRHTKLQTGQNWTEQSQKKCKKNKGPKNYGEAKYKLIGTKDYDKNTHKNTKHRHLQQERKGTAIIKKKKQEKKEKKKVKENGNLIGRGDFS